MMRWRLFISLLVLTIMLTASVNAFGMISSEDRQDRHVKNYGFKVEITGSSGDSFEGKWMSVRHSGVRFEETPGVKVGNGKALGTRYANDIIWGDLELSGPVLERSQREDLLDWYKVMTGDDGAGDIYRDVTITLLQPDGSEGQTYNFLECFLTSYSMTPLDASGDDGFAESITVSIGSIDGYPALDRKDNKGKDVSTLAHAKKGIRFGFSELGPLGVFVVDNRNFEFSIEGRELELRLIEARPVNFNPDEKTGQPIPEYGNWKFYQPVDSKGLTLLEVYNDFQSGILRPGATAAKLELKDKDDAPARTFELIDCFPTSFNYTDIAGGADAGAVQHWTLEVRVQRIELG